MRDELYRQQKRIRRDQNMARIMNAHKGAKSARRGGILEPHAGEEHTFQPKPKTQPARRLKFEQAKSFIEHGATFERDSYGQNRILDSGLVVGSITDTDARRLGLI